MQSVRYFFSYFPQFHSDPINDRAWGSGFTDWDLIRALPEPERGVFTPAIGYYDPSAPEYMNKLCKQLQELPLQGAGLMVYHYHFDGIPVLPGFERQLLVQAESAPPFFLCWANETWTKRWVGRPLEVLIEQRHDTRLELIQAHARYLARFFEFPQYYRIDDQPLFMIYNAQASPNLPRVLELYREEFELLGYQPLIGACIGYPQPPEQLTPYDFGCEFEPRFFFNSRRPSMLAKNAARLKLHYPRLFEWLGAQRERLPRGGEGNCFRYADYLAALADGRIERALRASTDSIPLMRSTFLYWDNMPRYRKRSTRVIHDGVQSESLEVLRALRSDGGLPILINSWNEWSEGAALEPAQQPRFLQREFLNALSTP